VGIRCADHVTPSIRKSRHYFADSGGRSVGIVRLRTKATEFCLNKTNCLWDERVYERTIQNWILKKNMALMLWTTFIWIRTGTIGERLCTRQWTFGVSTRRGTSRSAKLLASRRFCCRELVMLMWHGHLIKIEPYADWGYLRTGCWGQHLARRGIIGDWRKLRDEKLHSLRSSPNVIIMTKSRRKRWEMNAAYMGIRGMHIGL
jgi:hypothetical protein